MPLDDMMVWESTPDFRQFQHQPFQTAFVLLLTDLDECIPQLFSKHLHLFETRKNSCKGRIKKFKLGPGNGDIIRVRLPPLSLRSPLPRWYPRLCLARTWAGRFGRVSSPSSRPSTSSSTRQPSRSATSASMSSFVSSLRLIASRPPNASATGALPRFALRPFLDLHWDSTGIPLFSHPSDQADPSTRPSRMRSSSAFGRRSPLPCSQPTKPPSARSAMSSGGAPLPRTQSFSRPSARKPPT